MSEEDKGRLQAQVFLPDPMDLRYPEMAEMALQRARDQVWQEFGKMVMSRATWGKWFAIRVTEDVVRRCEPQIVGALGVSPVSEEDAYHRVEQSRARIRIDFSQAREREIEVAVPREVFMGWREHLAMAWHIWWTEARAWWKNWWHG